MIQQENDGYAEYQQMRIEAEAREYLEGLSAEGEAEAELQDQQMREKMMMKKKVFLPEQTWNFEIFPPHSGEYLVAAHGESMVFIAEWKEAEKKWFDDIGSVNVYAWTEIPDRPKE